MSDTLDGITERIRRGEPIAAPLAALLSAATPVTRAGMWWRLRQTPIQVNARVVSYGNLTAGGSGKTPAVIACARAELAGGHRVAVLTRGYGSEETGPRYVDAFTREIWREIGDEPALILQSAPGVVVAKNPDRAAAARIAINDHGCDMLILDDGYQYVRLARDENVLLIDATNPFGNGRLIPRGILREPLTALRRASEIVLSRCDQRHDVREIVDTVRRFALNTPIRLTRHAPVSVRRIVDGETMPVSWLNGRRIAAACAIGNPESFRRSLEALGARVDAFVAGRDHAMLHIEGLPGNLPIVVTEKDAVRMGDAGGSLYALVVEMQEYEQD